jgi:hypothetical protein
MSIGEKYPCVFCLHDEPSMILKLDKKGRPYFVCEHCTARVFSRARMAMKGPEILWKPLSLKLREGNAEVGRALINAATERVAHAAG